MRCLYYGMDRRIHWSEVLEGVHAARSVESFVWDYTIVYQLPKTWWRRIMTRKWRAMEWNLKAGRRNTAYCPSINLRRSSLLSELSRYTKRLSRFCAHINVSSGALAEITSASVVIYKTSLIPVRVHTYGNFRSEMCSLITKLHVPSYKPRIVNCVCLCYFSL